jgi:hypothetical protein
MITLFYSLSSIFIFGNIYYLLNYKRLDKRFIERDKNSKIDLLYYIIKVLFLIWSIVGIFTPMKYIFLLIISIGLIRIPMFYINKGISSLWHRLTPIFYIILLFTVLIKGI